MQLYVLLATLLALLPSLAVAFSDTKPFLAYSTRSALESSPFEALKLASKRDIRGPAIYSRDLAKALGKDVRSLCEGIDGIALVEVEELHSHSFSSLPASHAVKQRAFDAPSSFALQHVSERTGSTAREVSSALKGACTGKRSVPVERIQSRMLRDGTLSEALHSFEARFPKHLVIFTGADEAPRYLSKRAKQSDGAQHDTSGLFHRYSFWSTGLLLSALIVGLLFAPIVLVAVNMIGGITTPDRLGEKSRLTDMSKKAT